MGLKLSQLPCGESIFLDANIFLYSAFDHPVFGGACRDLLARVDREEVHGYCSAFVLNEVFHKLMMSEIVEKFIGHRLSPPLSSKSFAVYMRIEGLTIVNTCDSFPSPGYS